MKSKRLLLIVHLRYLTPDEPCRARPCNWRALACQNVIWGAQMTLLREWLREFDLFRYSDTSAGLPGIIPGATDTIRQIKYLSFNMLDGNFLAFYLSK